MFVILLVFSYVSGPKAEADIEWKKIKPAMCDLRLNGLISAMSASCSLPLSLTYWKWVLHSVQPSQYCIIVHLYFGSKEQDVHQFVTSSEINQGREDMFYSDFSLKWLIAFLKWHQQHMIKGEIVQWIIIMGLNYCFAK